MKAREAVFLVTHDGLAIAAGVWFWGPRHMRRSYREYRDEGYGYEGWMEGVYQGLEAHLYAQGDPRGMRALLARAIWGPVDY